MRNLEDFFQHVENALPMLTEQAGRALGAKVEEVVEDIEMMTGLDIAPTVTAMLQKVRRDVQSR